MAYRKLAFALMFASASFIAVQATFSRPQKTGPAGRKSFAGQIAALQAATPFQNSNGYPVPAGQGSFVLNHAWPTQRLAPVTDAPWQKAIGGGLITTNNAGKYAEALKASIATNGRNLIMLGNKFDAVGGHWYNEPWLGSMREPIQGTYAAGEFPPSAFPRTGLAVTFDTNVLTYYDERAAASLYQVWGSTAMNPNLADGRAQFTEGSIIVKAAVFTSTNTKKPQNWWTALDGAQVWKLLLSPNGEDAAKVWPGYVVQFDIIVKDSKSSPKTGWVFTTLVYDSSIQSSDIWDKMVVLGAQWGNDPQANTPTSTLTENWINPAAPAYSKMTLGFGGRLSGPNDGGQNNIAIAGITPSTTPTPDSGCMSCHSTSQWNVAAHQMPTFLLPSYAPPAGYNAPFIACDPNTGKRQSAATSTSVICSPAIGSASWMKWFQDRRGTQPMDAGSVATDFDEVFAFKSLPAWWAAVGPKSAAVPMMLLTRRSPSGLRFNQYTGAPLPPLKK